jgi:hypothetical protein
MRHEAAIPNLILLKRRAVFALSERREAFGHSDACRESGDQSPRMFNQVAWSSEMNDVAKCFAALEMIAREAPAKAGLTEEIRTRILAPVGGSLNSDERAIRMGAADLLDAVTARG